MGSCADGHSVLNYQYSLEKKFLLTSLATIKYFLFHNRTVFQLQAVNSLQSVHMHMSPCSISIHLWAREQRRKVVALAIPLLKEVCLL